MPDIEHTFATQLAVMDAKLDTIIKRDGDHETRIRSLERWRWTATGFAAAIGSAVGSSAGVLIMIFG